MSTEMTARSGACPWVLVADHGRARIFRAATPTAPLEEVQDLINAEARVPERELASDAPGRLMGGARGRGTSHSAVQDPQSAHHRGAEVFARRIASTFTQLSVDGAISNLYVIAEPGFLGILRAELPARVRALVAGEVNKGLARQSAKEIREALPQAL